MATAGRGGRGTAAPAQKSKSGWEEPQDGWIPIGLAIFRFGIADTDSCTGEASTPNPFSVEAFEQSRNRGEAPKLELGPPTLEDLTELLRKNADATKAEIDREEGRFRFYCGGSCYGGTPWALLWEPNESLKLNLRLESLLTEACEVSEVPRGFAGFAKIGDDEAAERARHSEGVRFATGLVWRQFMLRAFDRAVKAGRVQLFARAPSPRDDFQRLPSDIWPQLEVVDWEHGVARDVQGTLYSSIHVADTAATRVEASSDSSKDAPARHRRIRKARDELWPSGDLPTGKDRDRAISKWFSEKGEKPPHPKTIYRALK